MSLFFQLSDEHPHDLTLPRLPTASQTSPMVTLFHLHWTCFMPSASLPQGLCTGCSFCLECCTLLPNPPGWFCLVIQISCHSYLLKATSIPPRECSLSHHVITQFHWQQSRDLHSLEHVLLLSIPLCLSLPSGEISQPSGNFRWTKNTVCMDFSFIATPLPWLK